MDGKYDYDDVHNQKKYIIVSYNILIFALFYHKTIIIQIAHVSRLHNIIFKLYMYGFSSGVYEAFFRSNCLLTIFSVKFTRSETYPTVEVGSDL